jgi:UDP-N-acetyl-D-glucosamine dehydrogenase
MRVAIVGQGYVGQAIGAAAEKAGHQVIGIEIDEKRVTELQNIGYPVSKDFSVVKKAELVLIAVPTPLDADLKPDISFIQSACMSIRPFLKSGTLIVNESTSYPGTLREIISSILGESFEYAVAPERVDPGNLKWNSKNTPRIVAGLTSKALERALEFYKSITSDVVAVSSPEVAEAAKLFENTFRQVNIALVNEFAQIAHKIGISAYEAINAAATKPFGFMRFLPSIGVGGHCIPVDPTYLSFAAENAGVKANFIELANKLNREMPKIIAKRIDDEFLLAGKEIQIVGLTYKANTPDVREAPSVVFLSELRKRGAKVIWHDPVIKEFGSEKSQPLSLVDIGIICVAHDDIDFTIWKQTGVRIIDLSTSDNLEFPKYL